MHPASFSFAPVRAAPRQATPAAHAAYRTGVTAWELPPATPPLRKTSSPLASLSKHPLHEPDSAPVGTVQSPTMHCQPGYMTRPATSSETGRCLSKPCSTLQHPGSETTLHRQAVPFAHVSKQNDILRSRAASPMRPADAGLPLRAGEHPRPANALPSGTMYPFATADRNP